MLDSKLDSLCVNTLRCLAIDAVEKAKSGHPGGPLGAAALAYTLWDRFLIHNPRDPRWVDRDRFVLSAGHLSMLLYALLQMTGYDLSLDEIKAFRQAGSRTPGHPEYGLTPGVESTTGPLGQGFANGVGMAIAERFLAQKYNRPGFDLFNHHTYGLVSDGDLQEGVASEAASLAGNLQLGKIVYLYDSNDVQLDGPTVSFTEDVAQRFRAYGWNVLGPIDGLDIETVAVAIETARQQTRVPNLIICKTVIGYGSPHKAGSSAAHGEPLGEEEVKLTKQNLGWTLTEPFSVPPEAAQHMGLAVARGQEWENRWREKFEEYARVYPAEGQQLQAELAAELPVNWNQGLDELVQGISRPLATRDVAGQILNKTAANWPNLIGGAADLATSTRAYIKGAGDFGPPDYTGRNLRFGVREHAMGAILNGLALHGGIRPFGSTFLVFADYMRPSIRLAALMKLPVIYLFTHDSIGVGEDGPTHQPIEQLMSLRIIPNLAVFRPADPAETLQAWQAAIRRRDGPSVLALSRQSLPLIARSPAVIQNMAKGGYTLWESSGQPRLILIASGSELAPAWAAAQQLEAKGLAVSVVSLYCWSLFEAQPASYREAVLPPSVPLRISIEAGVSLGWERYVGLQGYSMGADHFGISAPAIEVYRSFGLTVEKIVERAIRMLGGQT
jgi:transketolase